MKTAWKILDGIGMMLVILFSGAIGEMVGKGAVDSFYSGKKEGLTDEALLKAVSVINSKLPAVVDMETRLDSTAGFNNNFRYNYTMLNYASYSVSASELNNAPI